MNSLERCQAVIHHHIPDRVPVDLHNFLSTVHYAGYPMGQALQDGEMLAEAQLKFWRDFHQDMLLVENGVIAEAGACGCEVEFFDDGPPRVSHHILADGLEKIDELEVPDPCTTPPMAEVIQAVRILRREAGDQVFVMGRADQGPGALALALRGYERFILDLATNEQPELIHRVLDFCVRVQARYALALKEAGAHGTATGGLGVSLLSPRLYRQIEHPYECRFIQAVNAPDYPVALHICGDATPILADMVATGAPILELDYKTDMHRAKEILRGKATFLGPVNPELIWAARNPQEVQEAARQAIEILAPGGEFILGPGCALGYDTPADNIHALIEAAWKYGVYRPDGSLING
ncbi:MAG: uroporphyrinogen decarboxylase family protein [Omnitrophica WOR_2 bacterium]